MFPRLNTESTKTHERKDARKGRNSIGRAACCTFRANVRELRQGNKTMAGEEERGIGTGGGWGRARGLYRVEEGFDVAPAGICGSS